MVERLVTHAHLVDGGDDILVRDAGGIADIDDDLQLALAEFRHIGRHGEAPRLVLHLRQAASVAEQKIDHVLDAGIALKIREHGQHGVDAELGRRSVRALAEINELFAARRKAAVFRARRLDAAGKHFAVTAHHVRRAPALKVEEGRPIEIEMQAQLQNTLFRIDDGEIRIGRKPVLGHMRDFVVMLDASPTALLVAADDELDLFLGDKALVFERLHGVKRADGGAFVVRRAATPDLAFRDLAAEGIVRPAFPCGDDVEMAKHRELLSFSEDDFPDVIVVIRDLKAHLLGKREEIGKALGRALSEGHCGRSLRERRICLNKVRDRTDRLFLIPFHSKYSVLAANAAVFFAIPHYFTIICGKCQSQIFEALSKAREKRRQTAPPPLFFQNSRQIRRCPAPSSLRRPS